MGKSTRYLESPATEWENSFNYRISWDDQINYQRGLSPWDPNAEHLGSGSEEMGKNYDAAWDRFNSCADSPYYRGVHLIRIDDDGTEYETHFAK